MRYDLPGDEIHIWSASLDRPASHVQWLAQVLSPEERARAKGFHSEQLRNRFIVGHGLLRMILSRYVGIEPGRLEFQYGSYGKPALTLSCGGQVLRFNLAHSHGLGLYAVARNLDIGVDLEYIHTTFHIAAIAERFFSMCENSILRRLPLTQQPAAFFNGWTRKEAFLKATGDGLARPLDGIIVSLAPGESARLLSIDGNLVEAQHWTVYDLTPAPGYVGAAAIKATGMHLESWVWVG